jgi:hypothetical protein
MFKILKSLKQAILYVVILYLKFKNSSKIYVEKLGNNFFILWWR